MVSPTSPRLVGVAWTYRIPQVILYIRTSMHFFTTSMPAPTHARGRVDRGGKLHPTNNLFWSLLSRSHMLYINASHVLPIHYLPIYIYTFRGWGVGVVC